MSQQSRNNSVKSVRESRDHCLQSPGEKCEAEKHQSQPPGPGTGSYSMVTHLACQIDILWLRGTSAWKSCGKSAAGLGLGPWTPGSCFKRAPPNTEPLSLSTALWLPSLLSQPEADPCCLGCTYIPLRAPTRLPQAKLQIPVLHSSFPM